MAIRLTRDEQDIIRQAVSAFGYGPVDFSDLDIGYAVECMQEGVSACDEYAANEVEAVIRKLRGQPLDLTA